MRRTNANRSQMLGCQCFRQQTHIVRVMIDAERATTTVFCEEGDVKYVVTNNCSRYGINLAPRKREAASSLEAVTATSQITQVSDEDHNMNRSIRRMLTQYVKRCVNAS
jgi:hypothetical protein